MVIVFGMSRTGTSSLEIALQMLGYNTINVDPGRAEVHNYKGVYEQILANIANGGRFTEKIPNHYDAFMMGSHLSSKEGIFKLKSDYKNIKFVEFHNQNDFALFLVIIS